MPTREPADWQLEAWLEQWRAVREDVTDEQARRDCDEMIASLVEDLKQRGIVDP